MTNASDYPPQNHGRAVSRPWIALGLALMAACTASAQVAFVPEKPAPPSSLHVASSSSAAASSTALSEPPHPLNQTETRIVSYVDEHRDDALALLERVVNINSGTLNFEGVKQVGAVVDAEFKAIGFTTRWIPMDVTHRPDIFSPNVKERKENGSCSSDTSIPYSRRTIHSNVMSCYRRSKLEDREPWT